MANCMTCRHNDKKAKYCPVKKAHTDLGYILNCIAWAPTDEAEMKRLRTENAKLKELLSSYWKRTHLHITSNVERDYLSEMRELGVEVD